MSQQKDKRMIEQGHAILKKLMKENGNQECADCKSPGPEWASWSLGIFICVNCSGLHRKIGVHVTRVRSPTLDFWTEEQLSCMINMGNTKAKRIYEANVPSSYNIPNEGSSSHTIENWIRDKYERKKFIRRSGDPEPSTTIDKPNGSRVDREREVRERENREREVRERENKEREREKDREKRRERESQRRQRKELDRQIPASQAITDSKQEDLLSFASFESSPASTPSSSSVEPKVNISSTANHTPSPIESKLLSEVAFQPQISKESIMSLYSQPSTFSSVHNSYPQYQQQYPVASNAAYPAIFYSNGIPTQNVFHYQPHQSSAFSIYNQ